MIDALYQSASFYISLGYIAFGMAHAVFTANTGGTPRAERFESQIRALAGYTLIIVTFIHFCTNTSGADAWNDLSTNG
jgi:hypothetical protein